MLTGSGELEIEVPRERSVTGMLSMSNHGLGVLLRVAREKLVLEKAVATAKDELGHELAAARKAVKANSYCWTTKDVALEFEVHEKTTKRWRRDLGLPFKKFGRTVKFRPGDVRWDAQRKEG